MSLTRRHTLAALLGFGMATPLMAAESGDAALDAAIAGAWRSPDNRARDMYRHPAQALPFWGLKPGMTIVEIDPGAKGWWVEILAPYARATGGTYIAAIRNPGDAGFWAEVADKAVYGDVRTAALTPESGLDLPDASADFVLVARAFHNWARQGDTTDIYLKAFARVLKPGGVLAVEQHRAPEGSDPKAGTGYVPESYVIAAADKAGLVFGGRSEINANPKDTRDHPFGVWTLPPVRRSSANGQAPAADFDRARYDAIGESDRMTLRFTKPA